MPPFPQQQLKPPRSPAPRPPQEVQPPDIGQLSSMPQVPQPEAPEFSWESALPQVSQKYQINPDLVRRVVMAESGGRADSVSPKGATGLMQLMPDTAKRYGVDPNDPAQNFDGGVRHLRYLLEKYQGNYGRALAAYNAGEGTVDALGTAPGGYDRLPQETKDYVSKILEGYEPPFHPQAQVAPGMPGTVEHWQANRPWLERAQAAVGQHIPESMVAAAGGVQKYVINPLKWLPEHVGKGWADLVTEMASPLPPGAPPGMASPSPEQITAAAPEVYGPLRGVARTAGGFAGDPLNWVLMGGSFATPLLNRLVAGGFAANLGAGAISGIQYLAKNWDQLSPAQRYEIATQTGVDTIFAGLAARGATAPPEAPPVGIRPSPEPLPTQVAPMQVAARGVEGGPRPVTAAGITGAREVAPTTRPPVSAPIEGVTGVAGARGRARKLPPMEPQPPAGPVEPGTELVERFRRSQAELADAKLQVQRSLRGETTPPTAPGAAAPSAPAPEAPGVAAREPLAAEPVREPGALVAPARPVELPKMPKGLSPKEPADLEKMRDIARQRDETLRAQPTPRPEGPERHPLHQVLTRWLKSEPGTRDTELVRAVRGVGGLEERQQLGREMLDRASAAEAKVREVKRLRSPEIRDLDEHLRERLRTHTTEPVEGEIDPKTGEPLRVRRGWMRDIDPATSAWFNMLRGNVLKEVRAEGPKVKLSPEDMSRVSNWEAQLKDLLGEVRTQGGRPSPEQTENATALLSNIQATKGIAHIFERAGRPGEVPGTRTTREFLNWVMGRPAKSHLSKPSPEQLDARIAQLRRETKMSREIAKEFGAEKRVAPGVSPTGVERRTIPMAPGVKEAPTNLIAERIRKYKDPTTPPEERAIIGRQLQDFGQPLPAAPKAAPEAPTQPELAKTPPIAKPAWVAESHPLIDKELLDKAVHVRGNYLVPIGGSRVSGLESDFRSLAEAERVAAIIRDKPGFPDVKVGAHPADPSDIIITWGKDIRPLFSAVEAKRISEEAYHRRMGEALGYRPDAIEDFLQRVGLAPKTAPEKVLPKAAPEVPTSAEQLKLQLQDARRRLAAMEEKGLPASATQRTRAYIRALEQTLGREAPPAPERVEAEIAGTQMLERAKREERLAKTEKLAPLGEEAPTGVPERKAPEPTSEDLMAFLREKSEPGAILDIAQKFHVELAKYPGREAIARPIIDAVRKEELTAWEATRRYARALDIYQTAAKRFKEDPSLQPTALAKALTYARTGRVAEPKAGEAGFVSFRGRRIDERVEKARKLAQREGLDNKLQAVRGVLGTFADWYRHPERGQKLSDALKQRGVVPAFKEALGGYLEARQKGQFVVNEFAKEAIKQVPDREIREAITNYLQAGGDEKLLAQRAATHPNKGLAVGYENATKLKPEELKLAKSIRNIFDTLLSEGRKMGLLEHGLGNYVTQIWEKDSPFRRGLLSDLQSGKFNTSLRFARQRFYDSFFDGEVAGKDPATKDSLSLLTTYYNTFNEAINSRKFVKDMWRGTALDERPLLVPESRYARVLGADEAHDAEVYAIPLHGKARGRLMDAELAGRLGIKVDAKTMTEWDTVRTEAGDYKIIDHPAFRKWVFSMKGPEGKPVLVEANARAHPDIAQHLENLYKKSWLREFAPTRIWLKGTAFAKQILLGFPGFHYAQEGLHAGFHKIDPFHKDLWSGKRLKDAMTDKTVGNLMRHGLMLYDHNSMSMFAEGIEGPTLKKIPFAGAALDGMRTHLFQTYIPGLKATLGKEAYARNLRRYAGDLKAGKITEDAVAELTAAQSNAAFGELNYDWMGRNKTAQDLLRAFILAPDWLEARARFAGQAVRPYGREQTAALFLRAGLYQWIAVRTLNMLFNQGDPKLDKDHIFTVKAGERDYTLRTITGDILHLVTRPLNFMLFRLAPPLRLGVQAMSEYFKGKGLTLKELFQESVPIPTQGAVRDLLQKGEGDKRYLDGVLAGFGILSHKYYSPEQREMMEKRAEQRLKSMRGERSPRTRELPRMPHFPRLR